MCYCLCLSEALFFCTGWRTERKQRADKNKAGAMATLRFAGKHDGWSISAQNVSTCDTKETDSRVITAQLGFADKFLQNLRSF